ncbi:MAG TPA: hypothetical protein VF159_07490 [Gemmatimonadaceae bacterium]
MLPFLLAAQLAAAASGDSVYATDALRALVARAAVANRLPPPELAGYRARVESELSLLLRDTLGREQTAQTEQIATAAAWHRDGEYDLHVIGYRSQSVGVPYSTLSIIRGWTAPVLYGDRLNLGVYLRERRRRPTAPQEEVVAVHPFAEDRDRFYRFSGGDTVSVLRVLGREIPVARITVRPHLPDTSRLAAFAGEIDLDATRGQIVRMRGQFLVRTTRGRRPLVSRVPGVQAVVFGEFVNVEVAGRYWLPAFQRTEFQATFALLGSTRSVFRVVSRFSEYALDTSAVASASDSTPPLRVVVSYAARDSLDRFSDWHDPLGMATASVGADDFAEYAPDAWRSVGPPRLDFAPTTTDQVLRFNRVEGAYTGAAARLQFRSAAPGLTAAAFGGWAWTERTPRGGATLALHRADWTITARGERSLASTNDFRASLQNGGGFAALLGSVDDEDYVDRREYALVASHTLGNLERGIMTAQLGRASDASERARLTHGWWSGGTSFRPNRGSTDGRYTFVTTDAELHPNVNGDFVTPGIGARVHYEAGAGDLDWQRIEVGVGARRYWGRVSLSAHADGGWLIATKPPPQRLFELGGNEALPGYDYKQFAGDRAALFRTFASYRFPLWQRPVHVVRFVYVPGVAPGVAFGAQGGWTELSSAAARNAVLLLGDGWSTTAVSTATNGVRATVGAGLTLFSDVVHIGFARPVDHAAPWRFVFGVGGGF